MKKSKKTVAMLAGFVALAGTAAASILPDLTVNDVLMNDESKIVFELANKSSDAVDENSDGFIYVYVDGKVAWTYNWKYLRETGFLTPDGVSKITSQIPKGKGDVKVCIDARENITEMDETNNCYEVKLNMPESDDEQIADGELPDLAVTNISLDPFSSNLIVEHGNIGMGDVPDYDGSVNIYVDNVLRWTYNYSTMNTQFLNPGFTGTITPSKIKGERIVTACTSTRTVIEEVSKENNCMTKKVSISNSSLYVRTRKPNTENQQNYRRRNIGKIPMKPYYKPDFVVKDVYMDEDGTVYAVFANNGISHDEKTAGEITFYLEGRRQKSYTWNSFKDNAFLNAKGESTLPLYKLSGGHAVSVCVDDTNKVQERNENNNCLSVLVK